jgi:hypothetical protein
MKRPHFSALFLLSIMAVTTHAPKAAALEVMDDDMALEAGMTPVDQLRMNQLDLNGIMNFDRNDYVTTIPSQDDISRVIRSHKQVIVIDKSVKGQTLTVYRDGKIHKLKELTLNPRTNREELVEKDSVKISTGKETRVVGKSGREYIATTPIGFFRPTKVYKMYFSNTWKADLPNAVFFVGGVAIHATGPGNYAKLGTRDSGGCARTRMEVSEQLRTLVMDTGRGSRPGDYKIVTESHRRDRVTQNTVMVDTLDRMKGSMNGGKVNSWDTVIVVHNN